MAILLNDKEIKRLIGTVIINGDEQCIRPNSYIIRLGSKGEFINSGKEFDLGKIKNGIKIQPGHSVAVSAYETLDFRRELVHKIYPNGDLHGLISPTTDLSREGIVAPTTQVDAGYFGTLNWTISNTSSEERRFLLGEKIFRLTIFKLEKGETPEKLYDGDYQSQTGYVRSLRKGPPVGMKESEWEDSLIKEGPEVLLENLVRSGYPWNLLGERLKIIDQQFKSVSKEYSDINDSIIKLSKDLEVLNNQQREILNDVPDNIRTTLKDEISSLQNRWLIGAGSIFITAIGLILATTSNEAVCQIIKNNGSLFGLILLIAGLVVLFFITKRKPPK